MNIHPKNCNLLSSSDGLDHKSQRREGMQVVMLSCQSSTGEGFEGEGTVSANRGSVRGTEAGLCGESPRESQQTISAS